MLERSSAVQCPSVGHQLLDSTHSCLIRQPACPQEGVDLERLPLNRDYKGILGNMLRLMGLQRAGVPVPPAAGRRGRRRAPRSCPALPASPSGAKTRLWMCQVRSLLQTPLRAPAGDMHPAWAGTSRPDCQGGGSSGPSGHGEVGVHAGAGRCTLAA